ncbi:MAG TPA: M56 family metallopeptidase [Aliidongia sp.]|nr:M56 family metallopeptidase [Aliidongia sp.]
MMALLAEAAVRSLLLGLAVGAGLRLARVGNPQVEMTAWVTVLAASSLMPLLMQMTLVRLPYHVVMLPHVILGTDHALPPLRVPHLPGAAPGWSWLDLAPVIYGLVATVLVLRLLTGLLVTWRIVRDARPIRADWTAGADVRVTARILAPVTFGRVILVPISFITWSAAKRRAVMGHERSHIEHHDFTVQVLSQLHSAVFWFSPFAWWLQVRLASLAETTSDEAAIRGVGDRVRYAEILLDIAAGARGVPAGIAMARPALLKERVERILSQAAPAVALTLWRRMLLAAALLPGVLLMGGTSWHARAAALVPGLAIPALPAMPAMPAIPPIPAIPPLPAAASGAVDTQPFAILVGGHSMISAGGADLQRLVAARDKVGAEAILFLRDGTLYGITDPALVAKAAELFNPANDVADQERDVADQQRELSQQQADIGRQMGDLGRQMSEAARRYSQKMAEQSAAAVKASLSDLDEAAGDRTAVEQDYKQAMADLTQQQKELSREQGHLSAQQARLGSQQERLGREQSRVAHDGDVKMAKLLDAAVASGAAKPVP